MAWNLSVILELALFLLVGGSLGLSLTALQQSRKRFWSSRLNKRIGELELDVANLEDLQQANLKALKRLNGRQATRDARAAKKDPEAGETPEEWKRRMRLKLHTGELKA